MGLLTVGKPHSWEHAGEHRKYVAKHGVIQFLNTYNSVKDITNDELLWGDECRSNSVAVELLWQACPASSSHHSCQELM
ncbi:Glutamate cysteine ligase [Ectocarpus siliculosus]|uniref:Glutamate--cysteine ligase n=1 Tax=Ectocarpus siliculosus TaxID=2880 RepID=D8LJD3_ECTSI|nr:Glutamate cysteine ligase [Ectocarpus siliculosus]|eukprot:CBN79466.1 Glutamate cysteine ligase [Ectocarpus siliculosus]